VACVCHAFQFAGSLHPLGLGIPIAFSDGPIRPITGRRSLSPAILYPLDHWAFLTVGLAAYL
jgi:hypothetical protein